MRVGALKSLMSFAQEVLTEVGTWCGVSTVRDWKTISDRFEDEGESFLTITLPNFAKDLEKGLEQGKVDHQLFHGFGHGRGGLPLFLGGFLDLVFDRRSGVLLDDPSVDAIFAIRQVSLMFGKVAKPCTPKRVRKALRDYIEVERQVRESDALLSDDYKSRFRRIASLLWGDTLSEVDKSIYEGTVVPKHGPGATADRLVGNSKYELREWPERLEEYFPAGEFLFPNWRYYDATTITYLEPGEERPVKVTPVPKTLKTPRIIAIEPTAMQYTQQAVMEVLVRALEDPDKFSFGLVGFTDQIPNQELARRGSSDGSLATLDLSEASDRVSNQHVRLLLERHPHLARAVDACRSRKADVPGHGVIRLAKFASMGSALTFPMEAMVFSTIIFIGIEERLNTRLTKTRIKRLLGRVRVYGDDIIVPADCAEAVVRSLSTFGYKVNTGKSFWTGKFRESCGREYYSGEDVSIVRVRQEIPTHRRDAPEKFISTIATRNLLYGRGLWQSARWLDVWLGRMFPVPAVLPSSPILGRHSFLGFDTERMCRQLHRPLVKGMVVASVPPQSPLGGIGALMKYFLKRSELPFADRRHLERFGRPFAVRIKQRLGSPV